MSRPFFIWKMPPVIFKNEKEARDTLRCSSLECVTNSGHATIILLRFTTLIKDKGGKKRGYGN